MSVTVMILALLRVRVLAKTLVPQLARVYAVIRVRILVLMDVKRLATRIARMIAAQPAKRIAPKFVLEHARDYVRGGVLPCVMRHATAYVNTCVCGHVVMFVLK